MGVCAGRVRSIDQTVKIDDGVSEESMKQLQQSQTKIQQNSKKLDENDHIHQVKQEQFTVDVTKSMQRSTYSDKSMNQKALQPLAYNELNNTAEQNTQKLQNNENEVIQQENIYKTDDTTLQVQKNNHSLSFSVKDHSIHSNPQSVLWSQVNEEHAQQNFVIEKIPEETENSTPEPKPESVNPLQNTAESVEYQLQTAVFIPTNNSENKSEQQENEEQYTKPDEESQERNSVEFIPQQNVKQPQQDVQQSEEDSNSRTPPVSLNIGPITINTESKKQPDQIQQQLDIDIDSEYHEEPKQKRYKRKKARAVLQREQEVPAKDDQNASMKSDDLDINIDAGIKDQIQESRTIELAKRMETKKQEQLENLLSGNVLGLPQNNAVTQDNDKQNILGEILGVDNFDL